MGNDQMDKRNQQDLYNAFENADTILLKKYIPDIDKLNSIPIPDALSNISVGKNVRLYHVDKFVYDKNENTHDKLMTVYTSLFSNTDTSLVLILHGKTDGVNLYIGTVLKKIDDNGNIAPKTLENAAHALVGVMEGNFPGTKLTQLDIERQKNENGDYITENAESVIKNCFKNTKAIAAVSGIAQLRNKKEHSGDAFVQGMEKLIDSMRGKSYTAVYIADLMSNSKIEEICSQYEDLYSQLSPFQRSVRTLNENSSKTVTDSIVKGIVDTTNESLAKSVTHGTTHGFMKGKSSGWTVHGGLKIGTFDVGGGYHWEKQENEQYGTSDSEANTVTTGKAKSLTEQNSVANALMSGQGESLQITYDNRAVKTILDRIDEQIKRLRSCEDFGMFDSCVYFISDKYENAVSAASTYKSLIRGEGSSVESSAINVWVQHKNNDNLTKYLQRLYHPLFELPFKNTNDSDSFLPVSPALIISGSELAYQFSFPKKSVSGLPVISCAEFGRNVMLTDGNNNVDLEIGKIYHMNKVENNVVKLVTDSLASHTFITGSTGTGKSNTVYQLIDKVRDRGIHFMVIEPAKGEYKEWLGKGCHVFGTNSDETELLYINPFSFPDKIHVLEHIDRLVEILNACWPMYAAMPAVLKDSIERVYINKGWNLQKSKCCISGSRRFPTFADLLVTLPEVMEESSYSADTKSDYSGALITRIKSLTNGLNGQLLCSGIETSEKELFEEDTIVDLSRVGSMETRSFFMGILVMKLQEYHMSHKKSANEKLKHITVLEEAHNLLRRMSLSQTQESSNLQGKAVEMLTNSIAEMRTYGEGFVIVDQAPGLLDEAVIRNTNTKIILRLPDGDDREIVGKSVALNDEQIKEVAKLPRGVAVVYQNNWVESVLCHFEKYEHRRSYEKSLQQKKLPQDLFYEHIFTDAGFSTLREEDVDSVLAWIENSKYSRETKRIMLKAVSGKELTARENQLIAFNLFEGKTVAKLLSGAVTESEGIEKADYFIMTNTDIEDSLLVESIRQMIIQAIVARNNESDLAKRYVEYSGKII